MPATKSLLKRRNDRIRQQYSKEYSKGYRHDIILNKLSDRWCLATSTLEHIVAGRDGRTAKGS